MTNPIETVFEDVEKAIEWPFQKLNVANKIIGAALKDSPALQAAVTNLVTKIEAQAADISAAVAGDGLNFDADAAAIAQAKELYSYVTGTFIPEVKSAIDDVETAAKNAGPPAAATAGAKPAKAPKPTPAAAAPAEATAGTDEQGVKTPTAS